MGRNREILTRPFRELDQEPLVCIHCIELKSSMLAHLSSFLHQERLSSLQSRVQGKDSPGCIWAYRLGAAGDHFTRDL